MRIKSSVVRGLIKEWIQKWVCNVLSLAFIYLVLFGVSKSSVAANVSTEWLFKEGIGSVTSDSIGSNDGIINGATWVPGHADTALSYNGSSHSMNSSIPTVNTLSSFSISAWVKLSSTTGWQTAVSQDGVNVSGFFLQKTGGGKFAFSMLVGDSTGASTTRAESSFNPEINTWYHLIGVHDAIGQEIKLFVDGVLQQTKAFTSPWSSSGNTILGRGMWNGGQVDFFSGIIDTAKIYNGALTQVEIGNLFSTEDAASTLNAPVISGTPATSVAEDSVYTFTPMVTDADAGDTKTFSITNKPSWATFSTSTGVLTGTPTNASVGGTTGIVITVTDSSLRGDSLASFNITVTNTNDAPVISGTPAITVAEDAAYTFTPMVADADAGDTKTFSITNKPSWATFSTSTGVLTGTPNNANVGTTTGIVITVTDTALATDSLASFSITVLSNAPVISGTPGSSAEEGSAYSFTPTSSDANGDTLTFSIVNKPSWANFNTATGQLSGIPTSSDIGQTTGIIISVNDGATTVALLAFNISVGTLVINNEPSISGSPSSTITVGDTYLFTPRASDDDGDGLTFNIVNLPSWANFNTSNGTLTGIPTSSDIGQTTGIVISTSDGEDSDSLVAFNITVSATPSAENLAITILEDESITIAPAIVYDGSASVSLVLVNEAEKGTLNTAGQGWHYQPQADYHGSDNFSYQVKERGASSETYTVSITISAVNDAPLASDDSVNLGFDEYNQYTLDVLANDSDAEGDSINIARAQASIGSVAIVDNQLVYQGTDGFLGDVTLSYSISDGKLESRASVALVISGQSADAPVINVPADVEVNATGLFTRVDLGIAAAQDVDGNEIPVFLMDSNLLFSPGQHVVYWRSIDSQGRISTASQQVSVNPLISLSKDKTVVEGNTVNVQVFLNGPSPSYPLIVPYTVSGSADSQDSDAIAAEIQIDSGTQGTLQFNVYVDNQIEPEETITINLAASNNSGVQNSSTFTISEYNVIPTLSLSITQAGEPVAIVSQDGGIVTVNAIYADVNLDDVLSVSWSSSDLSFINNGDSIEFSPSSLNLGSYNIRATVSDNGTPALSAVSDIYLQVTSSLSLLTEADSDGDGISDLQEGYSDSNNDGIPDYLDNSDACNVIQGQLTADGTYLTESEPGVCLRKGSAASVSLDNGLEITAANVKLDSEAQNIGGFFDFVAYDLPLAGQSYRVVMPQRLPIPNNGVYRKLLNGKWQNFVQNSANQIQSTQGEPGYCPPPGDIVYEAGLIEGYHCVQLLIEDGGPNDDDGIANNAIVDPGGVATMNTMNSLPLAVADTANMLWNSRIELDVLANDTDADDNTLTLVAASAVQGEVTVVDNILHFTPPTNFAGEIALNYSVTDGQGGTATGQVVVSVNINQAPIANPDRASTDDRSPIIIDVLANDSDADESDTLSVISVSAIHGGVIINVDKSLTYTPLNGYDGQDIITYTIRDNHEGKSQTQVTVTIQAYETISVTNNSSGGGSTSIWMLLMLCSVVWQRTKSSAKQLRNFSFIMLMSSVLLTPSVSAQQNQCSKLNALCDVPKWFISANVGHSETNVSMSDKLSELQQKNVDTSALSLHTTDTGYQISLGYQFTPYFSAELGYLDLGERQVNFTGQTLNVEEYYDAARDIVLGTGQGVHLSGIASWPLTPQWKLSGKVGVFNWEHDYLTLGGDDQEQSSIAGTDLKLGIEANYQWNESLQLYVTYDHMTLKQDPVSLFGVGLRYFINNNHAAENVKKKVVKNTPKPVIKKVIEPKVVEVRLVELKPVQQPDKAELSHHILVPDDISVQFNFNEAFVTENSRKQLDRVSQLMKDNPNLIVRLNAYSSAVGDKAFNKQLSLYRAHSIANVLYLSGINSHRVDSHYHGELVSDKDIEHQRVDISFTQQKQSVEMTEKVVIGFDIFSDKLSTADVNKLKAAVARVDTDTYQYVSIVSFETLPGNKNGLTQLAATRAEKINQKLLTLGVDKPIRLNFLVITDKSKSKDRAVEVTFFSSN